MSGPRILVVEDGDGIARIGADLVAGVIAANPAASMVAATGNSPMGLYAELAARRRSGRVDTGRLTVFQLDEYLGIEPGDRRALFGWMRRSFIDPLAIGDDRVVRLPAVGDLEEACAAFDRELAERGGLDLAILGLGPNGHLGFNEPPADVGAPTRVVELSPATIEANARYWGDPAEVPTRAVTMGMAPLLAARTIVLVVAGAAKHDIVRRALEGPVGPTVPASFLQAADGEVTVVVDRAAWGEA